MGFVRKRKGTSMQSAFGEVPQYLGRRGRGGAVAEAHAPWWLWSRGGPAAWVHAGPAGLCLFIRLDQPLDTGYGPPRICS